MTSWPPLSGWGGERARQRGGGALGLERDADGPRGVGHGPCRLRPRARRRRAVRGSDGEIGRPGDRAREGAARGTRTRARRRREGAGGEPLEQILLPVPSPLGKGVLVFPTIDREIIAGPTAREREDKRDWSVEADAAELILARAIGMYPPLQRAEQIGAYAGLRPAGRNANYVIESSRTLPGLIHVAAIRSTGLSASP